MCSHGFQGSFEAAEVDPTLTRPSLTTLRAAKQAVMGICGSWALLDGSAWKGRRVLWGDGKRNGLHNLEERRLPL